MQLHILLGILFLADAVSGKQTTELDGGGVPSSPDSAFYTAGYAAGYAAGMRARCNDDAHPVLRGVTADTEYACNPVKASIDRPRLGPDLSGSITGYPGQACVNLCFFQSDPTLLCSLAVSRRAEFKSGVESDGTRRF